jgi:hypothetical protein
MAQPSEAQIQAAWEVDGKPRGIPYPDYRAQVIANTGGVAAAAAGGGRGGGMDDSSVTGSGGSAFLADLAHMTSGDISTKDKGDGSLGYYKDQSAQIDAALNSPGVSDARKAELRQRQAELDDAYFDPREQDATKTLQNAGSDEEALKALQALEGLRSTGGGTNTLRSGSASPGQANGFDPSLANGLPSYDPTDDATIAAEWEKGPKYQGVSFEEYKRQVQAANPSGARRYTSPTAKDLDGTPKTFIGLSDPTKSPQAQAGAATGVRNAQVTRDASLGYYDNITQRAIADLGSKNKETDAAAKATLQRLSEQGNLTKQQNTAIANKLSAAAESSNAESSASTKRLTESVNRNVASNQQGFSDYVSGIKPYQTEIAGTTRKDVQFDPEGLAMQRASYQQGGAIYGGSLDYTSQGAQAYANPEDVARALDGINMLRENATAGGDDQRQNLAIARDEYLNGGKNQQEVYDRFKELSHPEMTAAERSILAQSQRQYATLDKSNRDAVSRDLEARGINSGAAQIAGQQAAQQRLGEERVAGTLGAQGQAVGRAFAAIQGMGSAADSLRTGNQNAEQLMQSAANALRAGDLAAANAYTVAAQRQREQGFDEEYKRGIAADNASANNQATRLGGAQIQANQANAIRSANDAVNMFNNEQQGITDRYNTSFKQSEYDRLAGLQQQTFNNRQTTIGTDSALEFGLDSSTQGAIGQRFGRTNTAAQTQIGVNTSNWNDVDKPIAQAEIDEGVRSQGRVERATGQRIDTAGNRVQLSRQTNKDVQDAIDRLTGTGFGL